MEGGRIHQMVDAVWGVDLVELHSALGWPQRLMPSRKPRCTVVNALLYAPATGRLAALPFTDVGSEAGLGVIVDVVSEVGQAVNGPDQIFSTELAEMHVGG